MTRKQKQTVQLVALIVGYLAIGSFAGIWLSNNLDEIPPVMLVLGIFALIVLGGVGAGVSALAQVTKIQVPNAYSYLPIVQDVVVFNIVKSLKRVDGLHEQIKKVNLLLIGTVTTFLAILGSFAVPKMFVKIATENDTEAAASKMLGINTTVIITLVVIVTIAYVIRVIYFHYIFRLTYRNVFIQVIAILPPVHLILVALLPNKLNSIDFLNRRKKAASRE